MSYFSSSGFPQCEFKYMIKHKCKTSSLLSVFLHCSWMVRNTKHNITGQAMLYYFYKLKQIQISTKTGPWSHGSWIYNYLYNQCLSPLCKENKLKLKITVKLSFHSTNMGKWILENIIQIYMSASKPLYKPTLIDQGQYLISINGFREQTTYKSTLMGKCLLKSYLIQKWIR